MTRILARRSVAAALVAFALGGCIQGAASTTGCPAFLQWQDDGFPGDLASADAGPRYLRFLAEVQDTAPSVAEEAGTVLAASQRMHDRWMAAGGLDGPTDRVEEAAAAARRENTPAVLAASERVLAYGRETCGVELP